MKMNLGIDVDEVVVKFVEGYLEKYKQKYNKEALFSQITSYHFWECLPISKQEAYGLADEFYDSEEFENIGLVDGAKDSILKVSKEQNIPFITSRPLKLKEKTERLLHRHFSDVSYDLFFSKSYFGSAKTKAYICKDLDVRVMVEDNLDEALGCANEGVCVFLMDKPWNQSNGLPKEITRVKNWDEILEKLI